MELSGLFSETILLDHSKRRFEKRTVEVDRYVVT